MSKTAVWFIVAFAICLVICGVCIGLVFNRQHQGTDGRAGGYTDAARAVNAELASEQQQALTGTAIAIDTVERIRGITEETDRIISESGQLDRRSSDIHTQVRKELEVLEDYYRRISSILVDYDLSTKGK